MVSCASPRTRRSPTWLFPTWGSMGTGARDLRRAGLMVERTTRLGHRQRDERDLLGYNPSSRRAIAPAPPTRIKLRDLSFA